MSFDQLTQTSSYTIYDVLNSTVDIVNVSLRQAKKDTVSFFMGYWENIQNEMVSGGKSTKANEFDKYPLIFLHADFEEDKENKIEIMTEFPAKIFIIARVGKSEISVANQRDKVFADTLNPIYEYFISAIKTSGYYHLWDKKNSYSLVPHKRKDIYFISSPDQNRLNEYVSAIELNIKLSIKNNLNL